MDTNGWITIGCTLFLGALMVSGFLFSLYKGEKDKREEEFRKGLMKKLDEIGGCKDQTKKNLRRPAP